MGSFKDKAAANVDGGGRGFFKARDHKDAYVLMFEPKSYNRNARNPFYQAADPRSKETRTEVVCDVTIFSTLDHLEAGSASFLNGIIVTDTLIAADLADHLDRGETIVVKRIEQKLNKPPAQPSWVIRPVEGAAFELVGKFYDRREAELDQAADELGEIEV